MPQARSRKSGKAAARRGATPARRQQPDVRFQRGTRAASIGGRGLASWDEDTLSFEFVLASETPCRSYRFSPSGNDIVEVDEVLSMDGIEDVDLLVGAPILNMHNSWSLTNVVGVIDEARIEDDQLVCRGHLWDREDLEDVVDGVRQGILRNMSVGFDRHEETYEERDGDCPLVTVTGWQPAEASVVAVPADPTAQTRSARPAGRRTPASSKRTAAMATRPTKSGKRAATVAELKERLERARAALKAARARQGSRGRRDADEDEDGDEDEDEADQKRRSRRSKRDDDETDGERDDEDTDGERDGDEDEDEADQKKRSRRSKRDDDETDGERDDEDEEDDKRARRNALIKGLRTVAQRRGKDALADFDAVRSAGGSVADLRAIAMDAVRTRSGSVTSTPTGSRTNGVEAPQLRSFSETALGKRGKR